VELLIKLDDEVAGERKVPRTWAKQGLRLEAAELAVDREELATGSIGELGERWSRGRRCGANPRETDLLENLGESVGASTRVNHGDRVAHQLRIGRVDE
jgi:hypothetical protein